MGAPSLIRRGNKYRARKTVFMGETYDSAAEANYAAILELERKAGRILEWCRAKSFMLIQGATRAMTVTYKPDFLVRRGPGMTEAVEVKGTITRDARIRMILFMQRYPNIALRVVNGDGAVIWPKGKRAAA